MDGIYDAGVATQLEPNVFHVNMVNTALNLEQYAKSYNHMNLDPAQLHERKFMVYSDEAPNKAVQMSMKDIQMSAN